MDVVCVFEGHSAGVSCVISNMVSIYLDFSVMPLGSQPGT